MSPDRRATGVVALRVLVVMVLLAAMPPVRDRLAAAPALVEAVGADVPRPLAAPLDVHAVTVAGRPVDLYDAGPGAPVVVLVPGAAPAGRSDPRVERLARALGRSHLTVAVPELDLYEHRFTDADLETLVATVQAVADRTPNRPVTLLGFSFGGSLALVTAADPRVADRVGAVATFGAYADMAGLVQAAATGASLVNGVRYLWTPPAQADDALARLAAELVPASQRSQLAAALDGRADAASLPTEARAVYELVTMRDPGELPARLAALPAAARERLARFSPAAVAGDVRARVLALHSRDDPAVPYAELVRMRRAFPAARTYTVSSFTHVDLESADVGLSLVRDLVTTWWFTGSLLSAARAQHAVR